MLNKFTEKNLRGHSRYGWVVRSYVVTDAGLFDLGGGTTALNDGNWHHLALVRSDTSLVQYVDGVAEGSTTVSGSFGSPANPLIIGSYNGYADGEHTLLGQLDEIRISKAARYTDAFERCTARNFTTDTNTVAYWKFDEGTGLIASDSSSIGNTGTLTGSPAPAWVDGVTCSSQQVSIGNRIGNSQLIGRSTPSYQMTVTNSPVTGSSVTITDTLGRVWGLLPHR